MIVLSFYLAFPWLWSARIVLSPATPPATVQSRASGLVPTIGVKIHTYDFVPHVACVPLVQTDPVPVIAEKDLPLQLRILFDDCGRLLYPDGRTYQPVNLSQKAYPRKSVFGMFFHGKTMSSCST